MIDGLDDQSAANPPQAHPRLLSGRKNLPQPDALSLPPMFARLLTLQILTPAQVEALAAFNETRALVTVEQGPNQERRALGHLMPDFYAQAVQLVGAGHITATLEQEGREPFFFAFTTQEPAEESDEESDEANNAHDARRLARQPAQPTLDPIIMLIQEIQSERREAREREEARREYDRREYERRESQARPVAAPVDPFAAQMQAKAQELQLKMLDKASRAIDEATNPAKQGDDLTRAVEVIERLAEVRGRADQALSSLGSKTETPKESDMVDMFERLSGNPFAQALAKKFFKLDDAPALPAPTNADAAPAVNDTPNPFGQQPTGAAANG